MSYQMLEPSVFIFHGLKAVRLTGAHVAIFTWSDVDGRFWYAVFL